MFTDLEVYPSLAHADEAASLNVLEAQAQRLRRFFWSGRLSTSHHATEDDLHRDSCEEYRGLAPFLHRSPWYGGGRASRANPADPGSGCHPPQPRVDAGSGAQLV